MLFLTQNSIIIIIIITTTQQKTPKLFSWIDTSMGK